MKQSVVGFAYEIIGMQNRITFLEDEVERLQEIENKYNELLNNSLQHSNTMMGNLLTACMALGDKGIEKAFSKNIEPSIVEETL